MTMIKTQFLLLSSILTRLDEVYPNVFIALQIVLTCPNTVASRIFCPTPTPEVQLNHFYITLLSWEFLLNRYNFL